VEVVPDLKAMLAPEGELYAVAGSEPRPPYPVELVAVDPSVRPLASGLYVIRMSVRGLSRENAVQALEKVREALEKVGGKLVYAVADSCSIKAVIHGSPFSWWALLGLLPTLLLLAGIVLLGMSIWQVIASVPSWVWATIIIGAGLLLFGPAIGELIVGAVESVTKKR
jgi:hypothetical protein